MSDPSQQCPSAWKEGNVTGIRFCGGPYSNGFACHGTSYTTGRQYNKVCGRVTGYQIGFTLAFGYWTVDETIDSYYVDGVSVTHGTPRNHIWTFAAGLIDEDDYYHCPCNDPNSTNNQVPPPFVGDNYYCESGNPYSNNNSSEMFTNDPLWDGQQCEGQCCSDGKSPPWFSVDLLNSTTDDIEVRICGYRYEGIGLQLLELFIQ